MRARNWLRFTAVLAISLAPVAGWAEGTDQFQLSANEGAPEGWTPGMSDLFLVTMMVIGVVSGLKAVLVIADITNNRGDSGWGSVIAWFLGGVALYYFPATATVLHNTIPLFPDLSFLWTG